jgi:hypothetical protein
MVKGETCTVKLLSGPTSFRSTVVKPYLQLESIESNPEIDLGTNLKPQEPKIDPKPCLQLESTKEPTLHNAIEHVGPARIDEPTLPT